MTKRKITVTTSGTIGKEAIINYHKILADLIVEQYGVEFAKSLLEYLKNEKDDE